MDKKEYNKCVDDYADALYRFIFKATSDKYASDDIVQESFIILWEHVEHLCFSKAKSYLFTTAYRKMIDLYRRNKREGSLDEIKEVMVNDNLCDFDLSEQLDIALKRLSDVQRNIVLLRDYEGYSYGEIAEIANLNESQVKVYLFRARNNLRNFIKRKDVLL